MPASGGTDGQAPSVPGLEFMRWIIDSLCDLLYPRDPDQPDIGIGWKVAVLGLLVAIVAIAVVAH